MEYFYVDVSATAAFSTKSASTITLTVTTLNSITATAAQWQAIRTLATTASGALYWRVRALDAAKVLTIASAAQPLTIDGGTWTVSGLTTTPSGPTISWTHTGAGIVTYRLEVSATSAFSTKSGATLAIPSSSITATSYTFTPSDTKTLTSFASKNKVTTLYYRIRGEDAQKAFVTRSSAQTMSVP
jgi:hypothetical protein